MAFATFIERHNYEFALPVLAAERAARATACSCCETPVNIGTALPVIHGLQSEELCDRCHTDFQADWEAFVDARVAESRRAMRGGAPLPCPRPRLEAGPYADVWRDSVSQGFRGILDAWDGFTPAGDVMAAGIAFGKAFSR